MLSGYRKYWAWIPSERAERVKTPDAATGRLKLIGLGKTNGRKSTAAWELKRETNSVRIPAASLNTFHTNSKPSGMKTQHLIYYNKSLLRDGRSDKD